MIKYMNMPLPTILIGLVIIIIIFLAIRELLCWYWKINERFDVQREIRDLLQQIERNTSKGGNISTKSDFNVGDKVRLTEEKLEQMRKNNTTVPSHAFGDVIAIDGNSADVRFGTEVGRVELKNLQRQG